MHEEPVVGLKALPGEVITERLTALGNGAHALAGQQRAEAAAKDETGATRVDDGANAFLAEVTRRDAGVDHHRVPERHGACRLGLTKKNLKSSVYTSA